MAVLQFESWWVLALPCRVRRTQRWLVLWCHGSEVVLTAVARTLATIEINTLQERVYSEIEAALLEGRLPPGEALQLRSLAQAMGTSEMPVREALKRLVAEHAVLQLPNRTFRVPQLTKAEYDELMMLRCLNEGLAARLAAERSTPALLKSLRGQNAAMQRAVERREVAPALKANQRFHFTVYEGAASPQLMSLIKSFWLRIGPFLSSIFVQQPSRIKLYAESVKLHRAIVDAIEARDGRAAERALINDFRTASQWYVELNWRDRRSV